MTDANPLARFLVPLKRWWPVLLGTLAVALGVAWLTLPEAPEIDEAEVVDPEVEYRATEILIRGRSTPSTANFDLVLLLARQGEVANMVQERMGDQVEMADIEAVQLSPDGDLGTLSVTATQPTPELAVELVTTYAEVLTEFFDQRADASTQEQLDRATQRLTVIDERIRSIEAEIATLPEDSLDRRLLQSEADVLINQYGNLQAEVRDLSTRDLAAAPTFETLQEPVPVSTEASPLPQVFEVPETSPARFAIAVAAALLVGLAIIFGIDWLDTRVRTRKDAEEWFGLPVVAELPHRSRRARAQHPLPTVTDPSSATAESFRSLRLSLEKNPLWHLDHRSPISNGSVGTASSITGGKRQVLLVTSSQTGEGKSTVVANLAASFAEAGRSVLVIDADFRRSSVTASLGVAAGPGIRELASPTAAAITDLVRDSDVPNVSVIRSGSPGIAPPWFLSDTSRLLDTARQLADVVIVDAGPLLATNEAAALLPNVDALLLIARSGRVARAQAKRVTEQLARLSATVAGVAMIGAEGARRYGYYYEPIRSSSAEPARTAPESTDPKSGDVGREGASDTAAWTASRPKDRFR